MPIFIAPGAIGNLSVRPPAAVIGTDVGGGVKLGALTIGTNELGLGSGSSRAAVTRCAGMPRPRRSIGRVAKWRPARSSEFTDDFLQMSRSVPWTVGAFE